MAELNAATAGDDPIHFFTQWFMEAQKAEISEVNAMTLATVGADNMPDARIVLLKGLEEGQFVFYTNYNSTKGKNIAHNPNVSLVFFWKELERQVRISGRAEKVSYATSEAYFHTRPEGSQLGAWTSPQSQPIDSRDVLDQNYIKYEKEFSGKIIPCPQHWGGYAVTPASIEFWQGRSNRIHDRIRFNKAANGSWEKQRLAP